MKKIIFLLFFFGSFVYGQQFANYGFESTTCINDCSIPNGQMSCVDGWWEDYVSTGVTPLKNINCDPNLVCSGDNSIFLMSTSGAPGSSVRTNNPFFGLNLANPTINMTANRSSNGHSTGVVKVIGRYPGGFGWNVLGAAGPNNNDVCENITIILDSSATNYEELAFYACTETGTCHGGVGNYIVIDDVKVGGDIINVSDNCGNLTVALDPSLNLDIQFFGAEVTDSNGNDVYLENVTGDPLVFNFTETGTYTIEAYVYYEANGNFEFLTFNITHTITSVSPLPVTISANGSVLSDLTYTIPCGENCVTLSATNLENATFNTTSPVLNDLNGLFCVNDPSITSFIADITGFDSCGNAYSESVLVKIEQDCCTDEPYIEPYWEFCESNNVCELTKYPIRVLDDDGSPLTSIDGYSFVWTDSDGNILSTSSAFFEAMNETEYTLTVTYPDGCVYTITYIKECCTDEISVSVYDCPEIPKFSKEEASVQKSIVKYDDLVQALEYYNNPKGVSEDCDPCDAPVPVIYISILNNGSVITDFESIKITWGTSGEFEVTDPSQPLALYTDILYTITVTILDDNGNICVYTYDYIYECDTEPDCEVTAPTNLGCTVFGNTTQLRWDAVTGAIGYTLYIEPNNPRCCSKGFPISLLPVHLTGNVYNIPPNFNYSCFAWKVVAKCEGEKTSPASDYQCFNAKTACPIIGLDGDTHEGDTVESDGGIKDRVVIYPNPNNGIMDINITTANDTNIKLNVYKFDGTLINTVDNLKADRGSVDLNLNLTSKLTKGIYFFVFNIGDNTISKKVMID